MTAWPRPSTTRRRREVVDSASKFADYLREMTRGETAADAEALPEGETLDPGAHQAERETQPVGSAVTP